MRVLATRRSVRRIGISIGPESMRLLQVRGDGADCRVISALELPVDLPEGPAAAAVQLRRALRARNFAGRRCAIGVEPETSFVERDGSVCAAMRNACATVIEAGLRPVEILGASDALGRFAGVEDDHAVEAILFFERGGTTITIADQGEVKTNCPLAIGGIDLDEAIGIRLGVDGAMARDYRRRDTADGEAGAWPELRAEQVVFEAVHPLLERIARGVQITLREYGEQCHGLGPARLVIAGSESEDADLRRSLERRCGLPVVSMDERMRLQGLARALRELRGPSSAAPNVRELSRWTLAAALSLGQPLRALRLAA